MILVLVNSPLNHIKFCISRFPLKNEQLLKQWVVAIRRVGFHPTANSRICSDHFTTDDYEPQQTQGARVVLKSTAVPSVFDFPQHLQVWFAVK